MACSDVVCWRDEALHALLHEAPEEILFFKRFFSYRSISDLAKTEVE